MQNSGSQPEAIQTHPPHFQGTFDSVATDTFLLVMTMADVLLASGGQGPGVLVNALTAQDSPHKEEWSSPNVIRVKDENLRSRQIGTEEWRKRVKGIVYLWCPCGISYLRKTQQLLSHLIDATSLL